jgi:hypothetical protein
MNSKLLAFTLVALAAVVAAGTGGYLAMRQAAPVQAPAAAPAGAAATEGPAGAGVPVAETEGVVEPGSPEAGTVGEDGGSGRAGAAEGAVAGSAPAATTVPGAAAAPSIRPARPSPSGAGGSRAAASRVSERRRTPEAPSVADRTAEAIPPVVAVETPPAAPVAVERIPPPPAKQFEEVVVPADAVIGVQIDRTISSEAARVEDRIEGRVTRDVRAGGLVAIPAGSRVQGVVTLVERGGKVKERARLGVRFHTVVLADGTRVPIQTETVYREGESPAGESAAKIGGAAVGGAILGAIIGGSKGAAIGGSVGAAGGTAAVLAGGRNPATLPAGTTVTVRLAAPATVTVEKDY